MFDREAAKREAMQAGEFMIFRMKEKGLSKSFLKGFHDECVHNVSVMSQVIGSKNNYIALCLMQYLIQEIEVLIEEQKKTQPAPMNRMR